MIEQGSAEWKAMRLGKVTASRIADMMAKTKTGWGASRANYLSQLVAERLTGTLADSYVNEAMQWGIETEVQARNAYSFYTGHDVTLVDFVQHPSIEMSGASPDGLVTSKGLVEIKCPNTATHIATLLDGKVPAKYELQMLWQMECAGKDWCDFVSFDPRMPEDMSLFVKRFERDEDRLREIRKEVEAFLGEVSDTVDRLVSKFRTQQAAE